MKHGEAAARKTFEEARQAVIKACADLREAEMFLDAFKSRERSAGGGVAARVASSADVANTHQSNIRDQVQPSKVLQTDSAPEEYAESRLFEAATALQKSALILGSPLIRHWFDDALLARAQDDMLQIQVQMLAELQRLNTRALEALHARQGHGEGRGAVGDVENKLRVHASGESGVSTCAECRQAESR